MPSTFVLPRLSNLDDKVFDAPTQFLIGKTINCKKTKQTENLKAFTNTKKLYYTNMARFSMTETLEQILLNIDIFFLSRFSYTDTDNSQDSRERERTFFLFIPLYRFHPLTNIQTLNVQLCTRDNYQIFLIATLVFTRLLATQ